MFKGDAKHSRYFRMVHGAIESGWREANKFFRDVRQVNAFGVWIHVFVANVGPEYMNYIFFSFYCQCEKSHGLIVFPDCNSCIVDVLST